MIDKKQIIKALELHSQRGACIDECPYGKENLCGNAMARDALSLVRELAIELDAMRGTAKALKMHLENAEADTVRRMQERLNKHFCHDPAFLGVEQRLIMGVIDQIAKELLEETK